MRKLLKLLTGAGSERLAEPIGQDLPAIKISDVTACRDCGNLYYLTLTDECPVCGSTDNLSPNDNSHEPGGDTS